MKKFIFIFSFLIGSLSMFANDAVTAQEAKDALVELDIPININAPNELYYLGNILSADAPLGILDTLFELLNDVAELILPDVISLDVLGIPGGLTIVTAGLDVSLWEVTLSEIAFNAIVNGEEGVTISAEWEVLPLLLSVNFVISLT